MATDVTQRAGAKIPPTSPPDGQVGRMIWPFWRGPQRQIPIKGGGYGGRVLGSLNALGPILFEQAVGRAIGPLLTRREYNATVTLTHTGTVDLADQLRRADVIIAAAGVAGIVTAENVKPGAIVLDVGVSRVMNGSRSRIAGDVAPGVEDVAGWISPNPGGVGPMTRAMLLTNVVDLAERNYSPA